MKAWSTRPDLISAGEQVKGTVTIYSDGNLVASQKFRFQSRFSSASSTVNPQQLC